MLENIPQEFKKLNTWIGIMNDEDPVSLVDCKTVGNKNKKRLRDFKSAVENFEIANSYVISTFENVKSFKLGVFLDDNIFVLKTHFGKPSFEELLQELPTYIEMDMEKRCAYVFCKGMAPIDKYYDGFEVLKDGDFVPLGNRVILPERNYPIAFCMEEVFEISQKYKIEQPVEELTKDAFTLDDTGNAYRFLKKYYGELLYSHDEDAWLYWDGKRWRNDQTQEVKRRANELLNEMRKDAIQMMDNEDTMKGGERLFKHVQKSRSSKSKEAFIKESKALTGLATLSNKFDVYEELLNVRNGTINLRTGVITPHEKHMYLTKIADVKHDKSAKCPTWNQFIKDVTDDNDELALYLKRMVGYCLTGLTTEQCMFILYGVGKNGKSTFSSTISNLLGDYVKNAQPETLMVRQKDASAARGDILRLKGARFVTTFEPDESFRFDEPMIKQMTGDGTYTARKMYKDEIEFKPEFKIVMSTNYKPTIKGTDEGIWRRVKLVPFSVYISAEKQDKDLLSKLEGEMSGILNWAVEGAIEWFEHGIPPCECVESATKEYRSDMDSFQQFINECVTDNPGSAVQSSVLYDVYKAWCNDNGNKYPVSNVKFAPRIKQKYKARRTAICVEYLDISLSERGNLLLPPLRFHC